jgi:hypothetical protein
VVIDFAPDLRVTHQVVGKEVVLPITSPEIPGGYSGRQDSGGTPTLNTFSDLDHRLVLPSRAYLGQPFDAENSLASLALRTLMRRSG